MLVLDGMSVEFEPNFLRGNKWTYNTALCREMHLSGYVIQKCFQLVPSCIFQTLVLTQVYNRRPICIWCFHFYLFNIKVRIHSDLTVTYELSCTEFSDIIWVE